MIQTERPTYTLPNNKLSMSQVRMFNTCPACWAHIALAVGSGVHAGLQSARQAPRTGREGELR